MAPRPFSGVLVLAWLACLPCGAAEPGAFVPAPGATRMPAEPGVAGAAELGLQPILTQSFLEIVDGDAAARHRRVGERQQQPGPPARRGRARRRREKNGVEPREPRAVLGGKALQPLAHVEGDARRVRRDEQRVRAARAAPLLPRARLRAGPRRGAGGRRHLRRRLLQRLRRRRHARRGRPAAAHGVGGRPQRGVLPL